MTTLICDVDHTLFDSRWRDSLMGDWDAYNSAAPGDPPVPEMIAMVNSLHDSGWPTICLTARMEKWRPMTLRQLLDHGVLYDSLVMRPQEDFRPAAILKVSLVMRHLTSLDDILVIDDREDVVAAFREQGVTVLQTHVRPIRKG